MKQCPDCKVAPLIGITKQFGRCGRCHIKFLDAEIERLKANKEQILSEAWQRVAWGHSTEDPGTFRNINMFDYPRYDWGELERLIKGKPSCLMPWYKEFPPKS